MTIHSKITAKGQTTVPLEVRQALGLSPGDRVDYIIHDGKVELIARNARAVEFAGILGAPPDGASLTIAQIEEAIAETAAADDDRIAAVRRRKRR